MDNSNFQKIKKTINNWNKEKKQVGGVKVSTSGGRVFKANLSDPTNYIKMCGNGVEIFNGIDSTPILVDKSSLAGVEFFR